ncbi:vascular endothelial growth factor receptor 2-like [Triplophysa rosa]|uniref:vascular endothelial growth factor receptor 2-like n=1 Tax=Triplophysa rosa TaxID=992332 RepID=UPI002545CDD5|nr:vascular endothelial growth factor receptor 2-like [Triplophysa rosa]
MKLLENMFAVMLCLCWWSLLGVFCESVSVTEGDSVSLSVSLTEHQKKGITWKFGAAEVAQLSSGSMILPDDRRPDGRFKHRLELHKTGSLTIKNIRSSDAGSYQVTETSSDQQLHIFYITVYARLPVPVISRVSSQCSSSSDCVVLCSVMNVTHVSLSWYKGKSLLYSISVSDLNIRLSLPLECLDDSYSYSCVLNNSITNHTQHLNTDVCHKCSDPVSESFCCCGFTEAVIRLVVSALVGVATVAVLVYDVRSRRDEQKKKRSDIQLNDQ